MAVKLFLGLLVVGAIAAKAAAALKVRDLSPFTERRATDDPEVLERCIAIAKVNCGVPQAFDIFDSRIAEIIRRLNDTDLHDTCSAVPRWLKCITNVFDKQGGLCKMAMTRNPQVAHEIAFMLSLLRIVCVTRVDVLNEAKSCLLELEAGSDDQLLILHQIEQSCFQEMKKALSFLKSHDLPHYCIVSNTDFMNCTSRVVGQQCGANVADSTVPSILSIGDVLCL